jgi:Flp pilus assembly protein TadD
MVRTYDLMKEAKLTRATTEGLYKEGQWAQALIGFDQLLENGVSDGNLLHDRAVCIFQLGRQKEALQELDKAVDKEPNNPYRYASRAWMRSALKDVDGAISDYKKALELDPEDAISLNNLGLLEEQYGHRKAAQERFKKADTLLGILKDAGVDPSEAEPAPSPTEPEKKEAQPHEKKGLWAEVKAVFTEPKQAKAFFRFVRNGFRS